MPKTNRRVLTIAAIAAAIVLVAGVAVGFALTSSGRTQPVAGVPSLATGLLLAEAPPSSADTPGTSASAGGTAATSELGKPTAAPRGGSTASAGGAASRQSAGTSAKSGSVSKSASSPSAAGDHHSDSDSDHRETVKPKVRDEHTDAHHD